MKPKEHRKNPEAPAQPKGLEQARDEAAQAGDAPRAKSTYEFKILPANPKNAFDFEDVADK